MNNRDDFDILLRSIIQNNNVYFQPPETIKLNYPCIVYKKEPKKKIFADNTGYVIRQGYQVMTIYRDPDYALTDQLLLLPYSKHNNSFTSDNLYHDVLTIYY